jgi:GNAT superfamily N-acetyltransferase
MNEIKIRPATNSDLEKLYQFEQGIIDAERPFDVTLREGSIKYYNLEEMITASHIELVVAEVNSSVVGCGYARLQKPKRDCHTFSQYAYLGFMYVVPEQRGKGIIHEIMNALKAWARTQDVSELRLEVYPKNSSAIRAYEKLGFTPAMIEMRVNLDEQ